MTIQKSLMYYLHQNGQTTYQFFQLQFDKQALYWMSDDNAGVEVIASPMNKPLTMHGPVLF